MILLDISTLISEHHIIFPSSYQYNQIISPLISDVIQTIDVCKNGHNVFNLEAKKQGNLRQIGKSNETNNETPENIGLKN